MAPRGPKTKPTHLKLVTGTERKGRTGEDEIEPPLALPMALVSLMAPSAQKLISCSPSHRPTPLLSQRPQV